MPSLDTADRPLTQKRSMSAGATRRNLGLSVMTTFTTTPKKRIKRLVLGPGENVPGGDQVNLSPEPLAVGERIAVKKGKKVTNRAQQESTDVRKQRMLVKRKHPSRTTEMLQHCDAEHEFDVREVPPAPVDTGSSRRAMAKGITKTTITRKEGDPLGLTIDENLVVTQVVRGTAAESAGLKAGIRLSTVDGVRIHTQEDAIQALRSAGQDVALGISLETTAPAMRQEGIVAGVQTVAQSHSARRSRRAGGRESSMPPFGCAEETASVRKPTGLGPPGLGPQLHDWGEDGASRLRFKKSVDGNDPFKPNLYVPELAGSQQRRQQGNKTSYEVADERGETDADGTWSMKKELMRTGKQQTNKEAIERRNGDIITDLNNSGYVETPRRGKDRAASPMACRLAASGAPKGFEQKQLTGRRCNAESYRAESELLHFNPSGETPTNSQRRTMTPGRYRHSPHDSGDFIGGRGFDPKPPTRTGIRSVPHVYDLPQPTPKQFRPTPRHQVSTPSPSDIFNVCDYRGDCKDVRAQERSRSARGVSPRNFSSIDLAHNPSRGHVVDPGTPRKGKASGAMVPPRPQAGYLPWGERE